MPLICPYCRTAVAPETDQLMSCRGCGTPHHRECYEENGGCTLFGCKFAPPDDPKVHVTASEVSYALLSGPPTGFGDVDAPAVSAIAVAPDVPPPPPPPSGMEMPASVPAAVPAVPFGNVPTHPAKTRLTFILLGIFLGCFGLHNFYAGYTKRGLAQLGLTVLTFFYGAFVTWLWALVEVCTVDRDHNNLSFR